MPDQIRIQLNQLTARQAKLQNQISTGQIIKQASDEPHGFVRLLGFQSETRSLNQFDKNIDSLRQVSNTNFSVVESVKKLMNRAHEIATLADDLKSRDELEIYAIEINEVLNQVHRLSNTESMGQYIFGGSVTDKPPYQAVKDPDGNILNVNYTGNESPPEVVISKDLKVPSMVVGSNESGVGSFGLFKDTRQGADTFNTLVKLRDFLQAGDTESVREISLKDLMTEDKNLTYHIGAIGATQAQMDSMQGVISEKVTSLNTVSSKEADADITETILLLNQNKVAYQAALQAAGQILNTSLLDYIR